MHLSIFQLEKIKDIQVFLTKIRKNIKPDERLVINYSKSLNNLFNNNNWLIKSDVKSFLLLSGFEIIRDDGKSIIAKPKQTMKIEYSVSIIIPARNEEENIKNIIPSIPKFGKWQEFIFIEGGSSDNTWNEICKAVKISRNKRAFAFKQKGQGKAKATHQGLNKATGDIVMIYDADRTVEAKELSHFYKAMSEGLGEFVNGSRLVYPMEKDAMRTLNKIGNIIFSYIFTWILGQQFKDTLCGTKVMFRKNYIYIKRYIKKHGSSDPFGDFDLIFGSIRQNLKVIEIPVHYKERVYGVTNIKRLYHGLLLLKMVILAFFEFKLFRKQNIQ